MFNLQVCTLWYRSIELLLGQVHYGPAMDVWSLGFSPRNCDVVIFPNRFFLVCQQNWGNPTKPQILMDSSCDFGQQIVDFCQRKRKWRSLTNFDQQTEVSPMNAKRIQAERDRKALGLWLLARRSRIVRVSVGLRQYWNKEFDKLRMNCTWVALNRRFVALDGKILSRFAVLVALTL